MTLTCVTLNGVSSDLTHSNMSIRGSSKISDYDHNEADRNPDAIYTKDISF
jgi:hypothetical protein